uniref:Uncharacterized protein n=1 Tax=Anguilla anguilla TaxID=7936 RepID=A0A0E9RMI9_ANGAN
MMGPPQFQNVVHKPMESKWVTSQSLCPYSFLHSMARTYEFCHCLSIKQYKTSLLYDTELIQEDLFCYD